MKEKIRKAVHHPELVPPYLRRWTRNLYREVTWEIIRTTEGDRYHPVKLDGYTLFVDLEDDGLSKDVAVDGTREPVSSAAYRRELGRLGASTSGTVRVLEVGANIGYYALMPAVDLDNAVVYAVEADRENADLLRKNVDMNMVAGRFVVDKVAFGAENGVTEMYVAEHGNRHSIQAAAREQPVHVAERVVPVRRGRDWLADLGVDPGEVDVLRMDVEGAEARVLRGLRGILDGKLLMHIELHPLLMDQGEIEFLRQYLADIEIVTASYKDSEVDVETIGDALEYRWIEIVAWYCGGGN